MSYEKDFEHFLSCTDEKKVILKNVLETVKKRNVSSLLDIGAGDGSLSIPLSKEVDRYVAVEPSEVFAVKLEEKGLEVKRDSFPFEMEEKFDMILISHALPERGYKEFLFSAWKLVKKGGCLMVVTYRDKESEWVDLLKEIGEEHNELSQPDYREFLLYMQELGKTEKEEDVSFVSAAATEDLFRALSFVFSEGDREKKERFSLHKSFLYNILESRYKKGFPFRQFFIKLVDF